MATKNASSAARYRNFATVVYPESAPNNWREILSELKVPCFISPLHDRDINPTGEPKKAHYHVAFMFEGKKSVEQVRIMFESFGGVGVEIINTIRGYARYLCHLDNPEKAQYNTEDVVCICGSDYASTIGLPTDKYKCIKEMMRWCSESGCDSYCELLEYAAEYHFDWFRVLCDNGTVVMKEYLKSITWSCNVAKMKYKNSLNNSDSENKESDSENKKTDDLTGVSEENV